MERTSTLNTEELRATTDLLSELMQAKRQWRLHLITYTWIPKYFLEEPTIEHKMKYSSLKKTFMSTVSSESEKK